MGTDITLINTIIETSGRLRCIKQEEIKQHEAEVVEMQKRAGQPDSTAVYIGAAEAVLSAAATAILLSNPVGWIGLAAFATAVTAGAGVGSNTFERIKTRRRSEHNRELTEWEERYFEPWLEAIVALGDSLLTNEARELIGNISIGTNVDPQMGAKALGDWCVSVAEDPKAFTIDDFALMLSIRHIIGGYDGQADVMESLLEAAGEADVVFSNADMSGAKKSFELFPVWDGPKAAASGSPYLSPVSKSLARIVTDYYVQSALEQDVMAQMRILVVAYYVKLHMKLAE